MRKQDLINRTVASLPPGSAKSEQPFDEQPDYEEWMVARLQSNLPDDVDIKTCEDFMTLGVTCCEICHEYHEDDLYLVDSSEGGKAWVCCPLKSVLSPMTPEEEADAEEKLRYMFL
jgi:hypothetical protein